MKKIILVFALGLFSFNIYAQEWVWAEKSNGKAINYNSAITTDRHGNVYATGDFQNSSIIFGNITLNNIDTTNTYSDAFLVKYDLTGNVLWAKRFGGELDEASNGIAIDASNNVYVAGFFESAIISFGNNITLYNAGTPGVNENIFIVKYDSLGNVIWAKSAGGSKDAVTYNCLAVDSTGNVYITGYFDSPYILFDSISVKKIDTVGYEYDMFIAKYSQSGEIQWASNGADASGSGIAVCSNNKIYQCGSFNKSIQLGNFILINSDTTGTSGEFFLACYDSLGNVIWAKSAGDDGIEADNITTDKTNNLYITGCFVKPLEQVGNITLTNVDTSGSFQDFFVAKYDSSGNIVWAESPLGNSPAYGTAATVATDSNLYIIGSFWGPTLIFGNSILVADTSTKSTDIFIVKYDSKGNTLWAESAGGKWYDYGTDISSDEYDDILISGTFTGPTLTFGNITLTNNDSILIFFIAKFGSFPTNEFILNEKSEIFIYPNPTANTFHLITCSLHEAKLNIYNTLGEVVEQTVITNPNSEIDLSNLPAGIYFVQVQDGASVYNGKVVKG